MKFTFYLLEYSPLGNSIGKKDIDCGNIVAAFVTKSCLTLLVTTRTVAHQASLSMGFPRQELWSGLSFPSSGNPPDLRFEPMSPALAGRFFTTE